MTRDDLKAVTFSVAKDHYNTYNPIFDKIIATLKMFNVQKATSKKWVAEGKGNTFKPGEGDVDWIEGGGEGHDIGVDKKRGKAGSSGAGSDMMLLLGLVVAAGVVFALKKKKGGAKKKGKKKKKKKA